MANEWSAPPKVKEVVSTKLIPKINEEIDEDEFQVELVSCDSLKICAYSRIKIKFHDKEKGEKEILGYYFNKSKIDNE